MAASPPSSQHQPFLGMAFAFMAYLCFSVQDTLVSVLTQTYPPLQVTWIDMSAAWLLMTGFILVSKGWAGMRAVLHTHRIRIHLIRGAFMTIGTGMAFTAVAHVPLPVF
jgi:drug/metabolite transporter (DMT)-like permease